MSADKHFQRLKAPPGGASEWTGIEAERRARALRELLDLADALRPHPARDISSPEKISSLHRALREANIPHALGGAVAVAFYGEPRSTGDIDLNVFIPPDRWELLRDALRTLAIEIEIDERELRRFGEIEIDWDSNLLHFFLSIDSLHDRMKEEVRSVPFNGDSIPIVSPEHLVIRKALLDRPKDWLDIEEILVATTSLDFEEIEDWLRRMTGGDDRVSKLAQAKAALSGG